VRLITVDEVLYFQSDTKYTRVVTVDGEALIRTPSKSCKRSLTRPASGRSTVDHRHANAIAGVTRDFRGAFW